jgi:hypothetical protein
MTLYSRSCKTYLICSGTNINKLLPSTDFHLFRNKHRTSFVLNKSILWNWFDFFRNKHKQVLPSTDYWLFCSGTNAGLHLYWTNRSCITNLICSGTNMNKLLPSTDYWLLCSGTNTGLHIYIVDPVNLLDLFRNKYEQAAPIDWLLIALFRNKHNTSFVLNKSILYNLLDLFRNNYEQAAPI